MRLTISYSSPYYYLYDEDTNMFIHKTHDEQEIRQMKANKEKEVNEDEGQEEV